DLTAKTLVGVRRIVHVVSDFSPIARRDRSSSPLMEPCEDKTLFDWDLPPEGVTVDKIFRALWASYLLSLEATAVAGTNDRAHVGTEDLPVSARAVLADLGIEHTPWDCVYGSGAAF